MQIREYIEKIKGKGINYRLIQEVSKDGISMFNIFMNETDGDTPNINLNIDEDESDIEEIDLRDTKAYLLDTRYKRVIFQLDGIRYQLEIQDDDMEIEEAIEVIEKMETAARN